MNSLIKSLLLVFALCFAQVSLASQANNVFPGYDKLSKSQKDKSVVIILCPPTRKN